MNPWPIGIAMVAILLFLGAAYWLYQWYQKKQKAKGPAARNVGLMSAGVYWGSGLGRPVAGLRVLVRVSLCGRIAPSTRGSWQGSLVRLVSVERCRGRGRRMAGRSLLFSDG